MSANPDLSRLPPLSKELVEALEKLYPVSMPNLTDPDRAIWWRGGQVDVVRFIRQEYEYQQRREPSCKVIAFPNF